MREVLEELDGPGVEAGVDGNSIGDVMGGGVTETERCPVAMWMDGRAFQKWDVLAVTGIGCAMVLVLAILVPPVALEAAPSANAFCCAFTTAFLSLSRSFFSLFLILFACSSFSTAL